MEELRKKKKIVVYQGNEACTKGAIDAGCRFFAGYPITPSTEIIEMMAGELQKIGGSFIQMEDEIGSACAIIGARWGGKKSMTATSGPGYSLMQEAIGFAASTETPTVFIDVQRGGPSTGQPTLSSQQDIYQARYGSHGDYEIIAICPSSVQEMYDFTIRAFQLAEDYRTPVILLTDEIVGHMREKVELLPDFKEVVAREGIDIASPKIDFYMGNSSLVEGQLHNELGQRIGHLPDQSHDFVERINKKITDNIDDIVDIEEYFMEDADIVIIAYGSVARPALKAVNLLRGIKDERVSSRLKAVKEIFESGVKAAISKDHKHLQVGLIKVNTIWPFPDKQIKELTKKASLIIVTEMNIGKYVREVKRCVGNKKVVSMGKWGGDIHTPREILNFILEEVGAFE